MSIPCHSYAHDDIKDETKISNTVSLEVLDLV